MPKRKTKRTRSRTSAKAAAKKTQPALIRLATLPEMLTRQQVLDLLQLASPRALRVMVATGKFPRPIELNQRLHRWPRAAVLGWFASHGGLVPGSDFTGEEGGYRG